MAADARNLRRGLPRRPGGDAWPPLGEAPRRTRRHVGRSPRGRCGAECVGTRCVDAGCSGCVGVGAGGSCRRRRSGIRPWASKRASAGGGGPTVAGGRRGAQPCGRRGGGCRGRAAARSDRRADSGAGRADAGGTATRRRRRTSADRRCTSPRTPASRRGRPVARTHGSCTGRRVRAHGAASQPNRPRRPWCPSSAAPSPVASVEAKPVAPEKPAVPDGRTAAPEKPAAPAEARSRLPRPSRRLRRRARHRLRPRSGSAC